MVSEHAEPDDGEIESSTKTTRAPPGFWTLSQIVEWIAFGDGPPPKAAAREFFSWNELTRDLKFACANRELSLLGVRAEHETAREIPAVVFSDPIFFFLPGNSIEPDDESAPPTFVREIQAMASCTGARKGCSGAVACHYCRPK